MLRVYIGDENLEWRAREIIYDGSDEIVKKNIDFAREYGKVAWYWGAFAVSTISIKEPSVIIGIALASGCRFKLECYNLKFDFPGDLIRAVGILSTLLTPFPSESERKESLIYYLNRKNISYEING